MERKRPFAAGVYERKRIFGDKPSLQEAIELAIGSGASVTPVPR
jgi:hypothetical protein